MQLTIDDLFATPDLHLFAFQGDRASFLRMDRAAYHAAIFVDGRVVPVHPAPIGVPIGQLAQAQATRGLSPQRIGWIFHVAQCGSTLLARGLDRPDRNLVLREPLPLRQLGAQRATMAGLPPAGWQALLRLAVQFAGRRYRTDLPTIVKANVPVNFMLPELTALDREAPAVFLYFALEPYLLAILRTAGHRQWLQRVADELAPALRGIAGDVARLPDAERGAALWLAQMRAFAAAMETMPNSRSLDADTLFDAPAPVLAETSALFGAPMATDEIAALVESPLFATYSKNPAVTFDNAARHARQAEAEQSLRPELDRARGWIVERLADHPIPERLARPIGAAAPLLLR